MPSGVHSATPLSTSSSSSVVQSTDGVPHAQSMQQQSDIDAQAVESQISPGAPACKSLIVTLPIKKSNLLTLRDTGSVVDSKHTVTSDHASNTSKIGNLRTPEMSEDPSAVMQAQSRTAMLPKFQLQYPPNHAPTKFAAVSISSVSTDVTMQDWNGADASPPQLDDPVSSDLSELESIPTPRLLGDHAAYQAARIAGSPSPTAAPGMGLRVALSDSAPGVAKHDAPAPTKELTRSDRSRGPPSQYDAGSASATYKKNTESLADYEHSDEESSAAERSVKPRHKNMSAPAAQRKLRAAKDAAQKSRQKKSPEIVREPLMRTGATARRQSPAKQLQGTKRKHENCETIGDDDAHDALPNKWLKASHDNDASHTTLEGLLTSLNPGDVLLSPATSQDARQGEEEKRINRPSISRLNELDMEMDVLLLQCSKDMSVRMPIGKKPLPRGQPEVWASGRTELCETLLNCRAFQGGLYSREGTAYGIILDGYPSTRDYMDSDVIVARAGGMMGKDDQTKESAQINDQTPEGFRVQALMSNMKQQTPIFIVCGNGYADTPSEMPHRYSGVGWFKVTHIWQELSPGNLGTEMVIVKIRYERLNCVEPAWNAVQTPPPNSQKPDDCHMVTQQCVSCEKTSPQVYLCSWTCLNSECADLWMTPCGLAMPRGRLDFHPGFLLHRTKWADERPPFDVRAPVPNTDNMTGTQVVAENAKGVTCPKCNRCCNRYIYERWQCDAPGCNWSYEPKVRIIEPTLSARKHPEDVVGPGPGMIANYCADYIRVQVAKSHGYKVYRYTLSDGSYVFHAKSNLDINAQPNGADAIFRELQETKMNLERRRLKVSAKEVARGRDPNDDLDGGARMQSFSGNFGMPYNFIGTGDTKSFDDAPPGIRQARSYLSWIHRALVGGEPAERRQTVDEEDGGVDIASADEAQEIVKGFNELFIVAYREGTSMGFHSDNEEGLEDIIATLSLGGSCDFEVRLLSKYFSQRAGSKSGILDEVPLPFEVIYGAGCRKWTGTAEKDKRKIENQKRKIEEHNRIIEEAYVARVAAYQKYQQSKAQGMAGSALKAEGVKLAQELKLSSTCKANVVLKLHLTHGDVVLMQGVQKFYEHSVRALDELRMALTCRYINQNHLKAGKMPDCEVRPDEIGYDGSALRAEGEAECVDWDLVDSSV